MSYADRQWSKKMMMILNKVVVNSGIKNSVFLIIIILYSSLIFVRIWPSVVKLLYSLNGSGTSAEHAVFVTPLYTIGIGCFDMDGSWTVVFVNDVTTCF